MERVCWEVIYLCTDERRSDNVAETRRTRRSEALAWDEVTSWVEVSFEGGRSPASGWGGVHGSEDGVESRG